MGITRVIFVCFSLMCMVSCSKLSQTDEYYVKYVFQYSKENIHMDKATVFFKYTDEYLNSQTRSYYGTGTKEEVICGPFKKGDNIIASCQLISSMPYSYNIEIYISKNNSPFALKGSGTVINYVIDY